MRKSFYERLMHIAINDPNMYFLTANLGYKFFDEIRVKCRDQFVDMGVAEQNMISVAAGMALCGKSVYCYSIIPFLTMRACEQVRMDICYHNLSVKLVGMGAGFTYGQEGFSHFGIEDMAIMRSIPNMSIVVPDTIENAIKIAELSCDYKGPLYIRLGRAGIHDKNRMATIEKIGKASIIGTGKDCALIAIGNMVSVAEQVVGEMHLKGFDAKVINMHTLKPLDISAVEECARNYRAIYTLEEHSVIGGLGSAVAEVLAESGYSGKFIRIGIPEKLDGTIGNADYLCDYYGLSAAKISDRLCKNLQGKGRFSYNKDHEELMHCSLS
jgi:transketolase